MVGTTTVTGREYEVLKLVSKISELENMFVRIASKSRLISWGDFIGNWCNEAFLKYLKLIQAS